MTATAHRSRWISPSTRSIQSVVAAVFCTVTHIQTAAVVATVGPITTGSNRRAVVAAIAPWKDHRSTFVALALVRAAQGTNIYCSSLDSSSSIVGVPTKEQGVSST